MGKNLGKLIKRIKMESVKLNKSIYDKTAINQAINDFSHLAKFKIKEDNNNYNIEIFEDESKQNLKEEFCNYVLGLMKSKILD